MNYEDPRIEEKERMLQSQLEEPKNKFSRQAGAAGGNSHAQVPTISLDHWRLNRKNIVKNIQRCSEVRDMDFIHSNHQLV